MGEFLKKATCSVFGHVMVSKVVDEARTHLSECLRCGLVN